MNKWFDECIQYLREDLEKQGIDADKAITQVEVQHDELTLFIDKEYIRDVCQNLRDDQDLRFEMCFGVSGVHYPNQKGQELHACYHFMSITYQRQIRLEVTCSEENPRIPTIVDIYPGNDWHERETWDLMGIIFEGHPSLTRTAMPDDWEGHPQRKDYPLGGVNVEYKGAIIPPVDKRRKNG